jgi:pimeloyl-ACP methyl ester carboxylesterase
MSGTILCDYFNDVLGRTLSQNGIGFLFGHNRGHDLVNNTITNSTDANGQYVSKRIGMTYERFCECLIDIDAWIDEASKLGYKSIVLMGHSLGCPKVVYYFSKKKPHIVTAVILASPADMIGLLKKYDSHHEALLAEAKKHMASGQPEKLLSHKIWNTEELSAQTFLDLFEENGPADVLPLLRNPSIFPELQSINVPMLVLYGTAESPTMSIRTLEEDLALMQNKATSCPSFTQKLIPGATHYYDRYEQEFANVVYDWLRSLT